MPSSLVDFVIGSACAGCRLPGTLLCADCEEGLRGRPFLAWPTPCPPGLAAPWAAAAYADLVRDLVLGHKEHSQLGLRRPLGALLAEAAAAVVGPVAGEPAVDPVVLVPVPSRRRTTRARGHEPTTAMARVAAAGLRARGHPSHVARLLVVGPVRDQAGLDAGQRAANLAGSMHVPSARLARLARVADRAHVVICDDVLTTGATAREAQRALAAVGVTPAGIAVVAATRRRVAPPSQ